VNEAFDGERLHQELYFVLDEERPDLGISGKAGDEDETVR
jgi:hypothetical protein